MKPGLLFRCSIAVLAVLGSRWAHAEEAWFAGFPDSKAPPAVAIPVEDGRHFLSVTLPGAPLDQVVLRREGEKEARAATVTADPVSRLVVFTAEGPAVSGAMNLRSHAPLGAGFPLSTPIGLRATTLDWVKQVDGKILPLALLKVHYFTTPPPPGTPLLDGAGSLVAIAYTRAEGTDGYAIPAEVAKHVVESVMRDGAVNKAWLGLTLQPSNRKPEVARVLANSPANRAGIREGDLLVEIGGRAASDYADAVNAFYFLRPSSTVTIKLIRSGQLQAVSLTPEKPAK